MQATVQPELAIVHPAEEVSHAYFPPIGTAVALTLKQWNRCILEVRLLERGGLHIPGLLCEADNPVQPFQAHYHVQHLQCAMMVSKWGSLQKHEKKLEKSLAS